MGLPTRQPCSSSTDDLTSAPAATACANTESGSGTTRSTRPVAAPMARGARCSVLARTNAHYQHDRQGLQAACQVGEASQRGDVGPFGVVHDQAEPSGGRDLRAQPAQPVRHGEGRVLHLDPVRLDRCETHAAGTVASPNPATARAQQSLPCSRPGTGSASVSAGTRRPRRGRRDGSPPAPARDGLDLCLPRPVDSER